MTSAGDDLNRLCEGLESFSGDTAAALALISDDGFYMEMKKAYAPSMVTAFIRLNGTTVGCVANRSESLENGEKTAEYGTELTAQGCEKAAEFVTFCDAFNIPVLTLVNTTGYKGWQMHGEKDRQGGGPHDLCVCQRGCSEGDGNDRKGQRNGSVFR